MPRLRMLQAGSSTLTIRHYDGQPAYLNVGQYAAADGGTFKLILRKRAWREPFSISQAVTVDGRTIERPLPGLSVAANGGLAKFSRVTITNSAGRVLRTFDMDFCPNSYSGQQRVNELGPTEATMPMSCNTGTWTSATVLGIDSGWAAPLADYGAPLDVDFADGEYTMQTTVAPKYAAAFRITNPTMTRRFKLEVIPCDPKFCGGGGGPDDRRVRGGQNDRERNGRPGPRDNTLVPHESPFGNSPIKLSRPTDARSMPDLVSMPAFGMSVFTDTDGKDYLGFAATVGNVGAIPLDVEGFRREGEDVMDAYQYFERDGKIIGKQKVGTMEYDPRLGHDHWHFMDFAEYSLTNADKTGNQVSGKQSFCIAPTDALDLTLPGSTTPSSLGFYSQCGSESSIWVREIMQVGWGDTYGQNVAGQAFDLTNVANGTYYVKVAANPLNNLIESNYKNNVSYRKVIIGGVPGARTVHVPAFDGYETEHNPIRG